MNICPMCSAQCEDGRPYCTNCGAPLPRPFQTPPPQQPINGLQNQPPYGQQNQPPYGQQNQPPYGQQNQPPYGQQNQPPYGQQYQQPYGQPPYGQYAPLPEYSMSFPVKKIGFGESVKLFFKNYANFKGRATRSEFWYSVLMCAIVGFILGLISALAFNNEDGNPALIVSSLFDLAVFLPGIAICVRRLHDIGRSGAWFFVVLIPIVGWVFSIAFMCINSGPDNQYGLRKVEGIATDNIYGFEQQ